MKKLFYLSASGLFLGLGLWLYGLSLQACQHPPQATSPEAKLFFEPEIQDLLWRAEQHRSLFQGDSSIALIKAARDRFLAKGAKSEAWALHLKYVAQFMNEAYEDAKIQSFLEALPNELEQLFADLPQRQQAVYLAKTQFFQYYEEQPDSMRHYAEALWASSQTYPEPCLALYASGVLQDYWLETDFKAAGLWVKRLDSLVERHVPRNIQKDSTYLLSLLGDYAHTWLGSRGNEARYRGDYERRLQAEAEQVALLQTYPFMDSLWISTGYYSMAHIYQRKGDYEKSIEYFELAISWLAERFPHAFADYKSSLAGVYNMRGENRRSLQLYQEAWKHNDAVDSLDRLKTGRYLSYALAEFDIHLERKDTLAALAAFEKAKLYQAGNLNAWEEAVLDFKLFEGDYQAARLGYEKRWEKSLKVYGERQISGLGYLRQLGLIAEAQGQHEKALAYYQEGLWRASQTFEATDPKQDPEFKDLLSPAAATPFIRAKLRLLLQKPELLPGFSPEKLSALYVEVMEANARSLEREGSKLEFMKNLHQAYEYALQVKWQAYERTGDLEELAQALNLAEQSKAMLLQANLQAESVKQAVGIPTALLNQERESKRNAGFYRQQAFRAELQRDSLKMQTAQLYYRQNQAVWDSLQEVFKRDYPRYYELQNPSPNRSLADIRQVLADKTAILSYFEGENELYIFYLDANTFRADKKPFASAQMGQDLRTWRQGMLNRQNNEAERLTFFKTLQNWSNIYLPWELAEPIQRLCILPDGMAHYLPFELLLHDKAISAEGMSYRQAPYLLRRFDIQYHYALSLLEASKQAKRPNAGALTMLAMAGAYEPGQVRQRGETRGDTALNILRNQLQPLPGAEQEVQWLQGRYQGHFAWGEQAHEATFKRKAENHGLIHLAMHGLVHPHQPLFSALAFSDNPQDEDDDFLHVYEIQNLNLQNTELVVLSACETGLGKYSRGEGVLSLGRSFLYAGSSSLLITLWAINDIATQKLVQNFYLNLDQGMEKDRALRLAKLSYLEEAEEMAAHPALWAAFVQIGDSRPVQIQKARQPLWLWGLGLSLIGLAGIWFWRGYKK